MTRLALLLVAATATVAHADEPLEKPYAFELDREAPPPGQGELSFDGGAPLASPGSAGARSSAGAQSIIGWAASIQLGYLDRPMRLHTTEVKTFPIEHRQTLALGGAIAVGPSVLLDARMPGMDGFAVAEAMRPNPHMAGATIVMLTSDDRAQDQARCDTLGLSGPNNIYIDPVTPDTAMIDSSISPSGGGQPHENMQPYLAINFCIAVQGIFPSRN